MAYMTPEKRKKESIIQRAKNENRREWVGDPPVGD